MSVEKQKTLLLVEDEAIIAMSEKLALERYGYAVIIADSGEQAVAAVEKTPAIDLILMDINLGAGMDGTEAAAIILKSHDLPVVFLSSHMEPEIVAKTEKITSYGYVVKDSSGTVLDASIKMAFKLFEAKISEKKKELALSQSNELLAKLARLVPGVIYQYRLDPDGRSAFPYASPGMNDIYEVTPEEVRLDATPVFARLHPDDYDLVAGAIQASAHTLNTFFCEFRVVLPRQGLRWRWSQAHPERLPDGGTLWHGIISDITERKLAEEALRESEERYRTIINSSPDAFLLTAPDGRILAVNASACQMFERTEAEIRQIGRAGLFDASDPRLPAALAERERSGKFRGELTFMRKSGARFPGETTSIVFKEKDGSLRTSMIIRDITAGKQANKALQENNSRLEMAMQAAEMAWWEMDLASGRVTFEKRKAEMLGYPPEKFKHYQDFVALIHPDDREKAMAAMRGHLDGSLPRYEVDYRIDTRSGESIWFHDIGAIGDRDGHGQPLNVTGLVINISERKRAEEAIQNSLRFQQELLDAVPSPIFYKDANLVYIGGNKAFERYIGLELEQFVGKTVFDIAPADLAKRYDHADRELLNKQGVQVYETSVIYADGTRHEVIFHKAPFSDAKGNVAGLIGTLLDISERKRAEDEIKRQLAEKDVLLQEVHHRIKNNIASIGGILSLQLRSATHPEAIAVLQDTSARVDSMRVLYEKLLVSKDFQDVSVKKYVESLADAIVSLFPDQAKIRLNQQFVDFHLDPKRLFPLGIIINELLTNIMKYAFAGKKSGQIRLSLSKQDRRVSLVLQDNGVGLPEGFDPESSAGFGLKLVKMLSQQLGGSFSIEKHKGTRCTVSFDV